MPFNWKTPLGYLITLLFEFGCVYFVDVFIIAVLCFLVGTCFLLKSFIADITAVLHRLNKNEITTVANVQKIKKILYNVVQDMANIKQLSVIFFIHVCKKFY